MKEFLEKVQNLPEDQRKAILWAVIIVLGLTIFIVYFKNVRLAPIDKEQLKSQLKVEDLKKDLEQVPKFELPKF